MPVVPKTLEQMVRNVADEHLELVAAGITLVVILCDEHGTALAARGNPEAAQAALASYVEDNDLDPAGWTAKEIGRA